MRNKSLLQAILLLATVWLSIAAWPVPPDPAFPGLDPSWVLGLNMAHSQGLVNGRDIVWTYGPLGYLHYPVPGVTGMYPVLLYKLGVYFAWCVALFRLCFLPTRLRYWVVPFLAVAANLDPMLVGNQLSIAVIAWCLLILLDRSRWRAVGLMVVPFFAALSCLIKTNWGATAICLFLAVLAGIVLQEHPLTRSLRWQLAGSALLTPVLIAALYAAECGTLSWFPAYIRYAFEVASGYSEAMSNPGEFIQAIIAVTSVVILLLVLPLAGGSIRSLAPGYVAALAYTFFAFKSAMVRQDAHAADFEVQIALAALFLLVVGRGKRFVWLTLCYQMACLIYGYQEISTALPYTGQFVRSRVFTFANWPDVSLFLHWQRTWADLEMAGRRNLAPLQASAELQKAVGEKSVEAIPWDVALIKENGWKWRPRPIYQVYSAYTPALDHLNADFLRSSRAADLTIASWDRVDYRHPFLENPAAWQAQLDWYEPVLQNSGLLVMGRRATPRFQAADPVSTAQTTWNRPNPVPQSKDPMVLKAYIGRSLNGRLRTLLFRLSPLYTEITRQSGIIERYRAVRTTLADGVIVNEMPAGTGDLALVTTAGCAIFDPVVSIRFQTDSPREFDPDIRLEWVRLVSRESSGNCVQIAPTSARIPVWGGTEAIAVSAGAGVSWSATASEPWVMIDNKSLRSGNGTVKYAVLKNAGTESREAAVEIAGRTFRVTQPGGQTGGKFWQIGTFRTPAQGIGGGMFALDANGNAAFDLPGDRLASFGQAGDIPVAGDWDGTGVIRIGVYRPVNGHWYLDMNNNGKWDGSGLDLDIQFGPPSAAHCKPTSAGGLAACPDIPIPGDWNGSGVTKLGIFHRGQWFLDNKKPHDAGPHTSFTIATYGEAGDLPVVANWNGSGPADQLGVYRRGTWIVDSNGDRAWQPTDATFIYGSAGDFPVTGDWNGAGAKRIGVFSAGGEWFLDLNGDHVFSPQFDVRVKFGMPGDLPVVGGPWTVP